ncbi:hypothetical protein [Halomonas binhaiensis]|uniref:Outer membrane protein beta-barrel domain-containing protein n=1 Tax=Halomonas binhaiensis TaxID=2562282 RepID=A0A5C1NIN7_9GAMM|nr:hypothetical protein [Halomonas binhaiensis]QEM81935.1 hypothetical protein E4T21_10490 [Halomonas binhaiensis]
MIIRDRATSRLCRTLLHRALLGGTLLCSSSVIAQQSTGVASTAEEPRTTASIYLWITNVTWGFNNGSEVDVDSETVLENFDYAFEANLEHRRDEWLYGLDVVYADIGGNDTPDIPLPGSGTRVSSDVDFNSFTTIATGYVGYRLINSPHLQLYGTGGFRYSSFEGTLKFDVDDAGLSYRNELNEKQTDVVVGLRGEHNIDQNWSIPFNFDIGGGGSDLTWQAYGAIAYRFGQHTVSGGYRYMNWKLDSDSDELDEASYYGPMLAYSFHF